MSDQGMTYEDFMKSLAEIEKEPIPESEKDDRDLILSGCSLNWNKQRKKLQGPSGNGDATDEQKKTDEYFREQLRRTEQEMAKEEMVEDKEDLRLCSLNRDWWNKRLQDFLENE